MSEGCEDMALTGKVAVVTGGAVGIGRAIVERLCRAGATVVFTWYSHEIEGKALVHEQENATGERLDTTSSTDVAQFMDRVGASYGGLDILVNNAGGLLRRATLDQVDDGTWRACLDLNLSSAFYCCREADRHLRRSGRIINISSQAGHNGGGRGSLAYASAKAGMFGLTRALAKELAPRGITVNAVAPGLILDTPFHDTFTPPDEQARVISTIPMKRAGTPTDVAGCVEWLCTGTAAWITGEIVNINGGQGFF